jgi:hypothetical protein
MRRHDAAVSIAALTVVAAAWAGPALAYDGWHLEHAVTLDGKGAGWDYVSFDQGTAHVFLGHRKEGLQVYDPKTMTIVKVVAGTAEASSNGAVLIPELDLGVSNNENGTLIPFKLSTLEAQPAIKVGEDLDTSHYDAASKKLVLNMGAGKDGTELIMLDVPSMKEAGRLKVASKKVEGADSDGKSAFYMAAQDIDKLYKIDVAAGKMTAEYDTGPSCGRPTAVTVETASDRVFVSCRGHDAIKPSLTVFDGASGRTVYSAEIGGGTDSVIYDAELKRIFSANGVSANLNVFEQDGPDSYKPVETLGTRAGMRTMAMDHKSKTIYAVTAEGTADPSKKILTAVSPFYANTIFPNTFTVLTYGKP